jgi:hypothetical protein
MGDIAILIFDVSDGRNGLDEVSPWRDEGTLQFIFVETFC